MKRVVHRDKKKLSIHSARNSLTAIWWVLSVPLIITALIFTVQQKYGEGVDALTGISWVFQCTLPAGLLMISMMTMVGQKHLVKMNVDNMHLYYFSLSSIWIYFLILYAIFWGGPKTGFNGTQLVALSGWFLGPLQGIIMTIVGKFFLEPLGSE